jgi:pilus assembly protein CpaB
VAECGTLDNTSDYARAVYIRSRACRILELPACCRECAFGVYARQRLGIEALGFCWRCFTGLQRLITAFLVAAMLAGGVTFLFYRRINASTSHGRVAQIVAAKTDLPVGVTLSSDNVTMLDWYSDALPSGAFTNISDVNGHPLLYPMAAREPILQRDLGVIGAGIGLAGKIPEGMRATAVRSNELVGVAGFLYPGSHVDLLVTFTPPGGSVPVTQTVLQNVEVLTAGQAIEPDPQGKPQQVNVVTLLLTPEDSQKVQLASAQGNIQFVLRSGADQTKNAELRPTRLDELANGSKPAPRVLAAPGVRRALPRKADPPPAVLIEVIQGTQRSVQKF